MYRHRLLPWVVLLAVALSCGTVRAADPNDFLVWNYGSPVQMYGRLYVPDDYDEENSYSLVLFLHGVGEGGTDNVSQVNSNINNLFSECVEREVFLYAPQSPNNWFNATMIGWALTKIDEAIQTYNIDPDRIYVTGLSAGGAGVFEAMENYPDDFAAAVSICAACGTRDPEMVANLVGKPFWMFEGLDAYTGANRGAVNAIRYADGGKPPLTFPLDANPGNPYYNTGAPYYTNGTTFYEENYLRYTEYDDETHYIWSMVYNEEWMYDWLFAQTLTSPVGNDAPSVSAGSDIYITWPTNQVSLDATVTDDGDPDPPGAVWTLWSKQSGPGTVTFGNASAVDTTATFSAVGVYELVLTADDSGQQGHDVIMVTVYDPAQGSIRIIDDGAPGYAEHGGSWSGSTTSGYLSDMAWDADETDSYATYQFGGLTPGSYVVRTTYVAASNRNDATPYTVYDGTPDDTALGTVYINQKTAPSGYSYDSVQWDTIGTYTITGSTMAVKIAVVYGEGFSIADAVLIDLISAGNVAPSVDAGSNDSITLPTDTVNLDATVTDDDLPDPPAAFTVQWTKQSGPGTVTFGDDEAIDTTATFSTSGTYVLRLTADDSALDAYDEVTITVNSAGNTAPSVNAGSDDSITLPTDTVSLDATVSDDGNPNPPGAVTVEWTKQSGPGTVTFGNDEAVDTTATFSTSGTYVLRLTADDSALDAYDEVTITVNPQGGEDEPLNVLFIGNSFTAQNIATTFARLAMDAGWQPPNVTDAAVVSQTLEWHTTNQDTLDDIDVGGWDYVVLQEYSTRPTDSQTATNADPLQFKEDATWLYDRVKSSSPNAEIILYETWARHENHSSYPTDYDDRDDMQDQLNYHYHDAADSYIPNNSTAQDTDDVTVATVGEAWHLNYEGANLMLHDVDLYHGASTGEYLSAMVIYSTIYGRSVAGRTPQLGVSSANAAYLQGIADATTGITTSGGPDGPRSNGVFEGSFEEPSLDTDSAFTNREVVGWTVDAGTTNGLGVRNSKDDLFANTSYSGGVDQTLSSPADGYQFLWVNSGEVSQQLPDLQQVNTEYTLTVAVGRILKATYVDTTYYIKLYAGDTLLDTVTGNTADITLGEFEDKVLTVQTDGSADTTLPLRIHLGREGTHTSTKLAFDNVRLTSSPLGGNVAPSVDAGSNDSITLPTDTVNLDATVTDDGLPDPPGAFTVQWTKQSGPGTVTFGNDEAVDTTATFSAAGSYVLRLTADDGDLTDDDEVTITVNSAGNTAPSVDAGSDDSITLPTDTVSLDGTVTDDGNPNPPGAVTVEWTKQSGPGTVTFGNDEAVDTTATFSTSGTYVLRLTADDSALDDYDEVTITVNQASQPTLTVMDNGDTGYAEHGGTWWHSSTQGYLGDSAGDSDETNTYATYTFTGLTPGAYYVRTTYYQHSNRNDAVPYTVYDGTDTGGTSLGTVYINQQTVPSGYSYDGWQWDQLNPGGNGTYTITGSTLTVKIEVVYGEGYSMADGVMIEPINTAPSVNAGSDDSITLPTDTVSLDATVTDDGLPETPGSVTVEWTKQSGPGTVTFGNDEAVDTTATFSTYGTYVLRLTADDGELTDYDEVTITVNQASQPTISVIDNGDTGYTEHGGSWWHGSNEGYLGDTAGDSDETNSYATFEFTGLTPGDYYVRTTYTSAGNRNDAVPYTVYDGTEAGTSLGTVYINQYTAPSGYSYDSWQWDQLNPGGSGMYTITGTTLTVKIAVVYGEGYSMADAVMIDGPN